MKLHHKAVCVHKIACLAIVAFVPGASVALAAADDDPPEAAAARAKRGCTGCPGPSG